MSWQLLRYVNKGAESLASELIQVTHSGFVLGVSANQEWLYTGVSTFGKHYYFTIGVLNHDGHHFPD